MQVAKKAMRKPKHDPLIVFDMQNQPLQHIGVIAVDNSTVDLAAELAKKLNLPLVEDETGWNALLRVRSHRLELYSAIDPDLQQGVWVDFTKGRARHRRLQGMELLIKAVKVKKRAPTYIVDATGGLGRDAFLLASYGFRVHVIEINPVVAALLEDGLQRAARVAETSAACGRITLSIGDSIAMLALLTPRPDVVYLDPMFPPRTKSAKVKKDLQLLQRIQFKAGNHDELLRAARSVHPQKVVVKRPLKGGFIAGEPPSYSLKGRTVRFDIYQNM